MTVKTSHSPSPIARVVNTRHDRVGESPVWSVFEQALYWVDIEGRSIHRMPWTNGLRADAQTSWRVDERVGCIALSQRGTVIAAMETGIFEIALGAAGSVTATCLAKFDAPHTNMRFNDGRCDAQGRFWISTMCRDMSLAAPVGGLYCLDEMGLRGPLVSGLITPNGLAFSGNGLRAYLSDSHPSSQKIWTFDLQPETGTLSNRALWVDMQTMPGRPDGAAVDAEDCYWICANDAGRVHRFDTQGQLLESLVLPVAKPSMCAFGGPQLSHLFVTSITPTNPVDGFDSALDGALFVFETDVVGRAEPVFSSYPSAVLAKT
jgi:sugar lactone lactonase YvrE